MKRWPTLRTRTNGFTLAEVAVTLLIMGLGMLSVLQGLNTAKLMAAHTRNYKLARELGLPKLEQIGSAIFKDDIKSGLTGSFAQEGYPEFSYEVVVGDESFRQKKADGSFDSWAPRDSAKDTKKKDDEKDDTQPFEKVKIRITYPKIQQLSNELILERWYPWVQVYGEDETKKAKAAAAAAAGTNTSGNTAGTGTGSTGGAQQPASSTGAKKP